MLRTSAEARKRAAQFHAAAAVNPNRLPPVGYINGNGFGRDGLPLGLPPQKNLGNGSANNRNHRDAPSQSSTSHPSNVRDTPTDDSSQTSSQDAPTIASSTTSLTIHNKQKSTDPKSSSSSKAASNRSSSSNQKSNLSQSANRQNSEDTPPPIRKYVPGPAERARIKAAIERTSSAAAKRRRREPATVRPSSDEDEGDEENNSTNGRSSKYNGLGRRYSGSEESDSQEEVTQAPKRARTVAPAWKRKVFLSTGLYSQEFKVDGMGDAGSVSSSSTPVPEKPKEVFPQPLHFGMDLLTDEQSFRLPEHYFEVAEEARARIAAKKFKKPPSYTFIRTNQYTSRPKLPGEVPVCFCDPDDNCGESCMNRLMQFICNPKHCPCGEKCTNGSLGKRPTAKLDVQHYGARGFGLRTLQPLKKDDFITEYRGEVINQDEATRRVAEHYHKTGRYYLLDYDAAAGEVLDAGLKGNITRFANHSIGLFALRDIEVGEELTYDYGWSAFGPKQAAGELGENACHCGAANCCGELGGKKVTGPISIAPAPIPTRPIKSGARDRNGKFRGGRQAPMVKGRVVKQRYKAAMAAKAAAPRNQSAKSATGLGSSSNARPSSDEDDKSRKPPKFPSQTDINSILRGGAQNNGTFAPDLPSILASNGMSMRAARRVRNAWLARIRRLRKRGVTQNEAILEASRRGEIASASHKNRDEEPATKKAVAALKGPNKRSAGTTFPSKNGLHASKPTGKPKNAEASSAAKSNSREAQRPSVTLRPSVTPSPPPSSRPATSVSNQAKGKEKAKENETEKGKGKEKEKEKEKVKEKENEKVKKKEKAKEMEKVKAKEKEKELPASIPKKSIGAASFYSTTARITSPATKRGANEVVSASSDEEDSDGDAANDSIRKGWIRPSGTRNSAKVSTSKPEDTSSTSSRSSRRTIVTPSKDVPVPLRQRGGSQGPSTHQVRHRISSPILVPVLPEEPLVIPRRKNNEAERLAHEAQMSRLGGGMSSDANEESVSRTRSRRSAAGPADAKAQTSPVAKATKDAGDKAESISAGTASSIAEAHKAKSPSTEKPENSTVAASPPKARKLPPTGRRRSEAERLAEDPMHSTPPAISGGRTLARRVTSTPPVPAKRRPAATRSYAEPNTSDSDLEEPARPSKEPNVGQTTAPILERRNRLSFEKDKADEPALKKARIDGPSSFANKPNEINTSSASSTRVTNSGNVLAGGDDDKVSKQLASTPGEPSSMSTRRSALLKSRASAPSSVRVAANATGAATTPVASASAAARPSSAVSPEKKAASTSKALTPKSALSTPVPKGKKETQPRMSAPGAMINEDNSAPDHPSPNSRGPPSASTSTPTSASAPPKKSTKFVYTHRTCHWCKTHETGVWRPGPSGPATLCNACGSKWRRHRIAEGLIPDPAAKRKEAQAEAAAKGIL